MIAKQASQPGIVAADAVYTLDEIKSRLGLGSAALREARRKGLKVRRIGRRGFVFGEDLIAFLRSASAEA